MAADMALQKYNLMFDQNISALKPLQQKSLESLLHHDVVAILPTGYGKSLLYELLPFYHLEVTGNPAVVLVIEPLNVIIEEQMKKLSDSSFLLRNSSSYDFIKDFEKGKTMYIFAHPEAVVGKPEVYKLLQSVSDYMYIVVDEAHCILDWGHDFRPIFREIKQLRAVRPDAKFLALSATVSVNGVVDITKFLGMENPKLIKTSPLRDNLSLIVLRRPSRKVSTQASYDYIFENVFCDLKRNEEDYPVTLIYCVGINWVGYGYEVAQRILGDDMFDGVRDIEHARVVMFHSSIGRDEETKGMIYKNISKHPNETPLRVVISTIALGMGADLRHVRTVIHAGLPQNIEAYIQQIGRAGRSGIQAEGILYFNNSDIGNSSVKKSMMEYCKNESECRRKVLNTYFGCENETSMNKCCDICQPDLGFLWKFNEIPNNIQKSAIREKIVNLLAETDCVLDTYIVEKIVNEAHLFTNSKYLVSEFGLDINLSEKVASILASH